LHAPAIQKNNKAEKAKQVPNTYSIGDTRTYLKEEQKMRMRHQPHESPYTTDIVNNDGMVCHIICHLMPFSMLTPFFVHGGRAVLPK
jgi:hypothetical protein